MAWSVLCGWIITNMAECPDQDESDMGKEEPQQKVERPTLEHQVGPNLPNAPSVADPKLLEAIAVKDQRIATLEDALKTKCSQLDDMEQQMQNLAAEKQRMDSMRKESEKGRVLAVKKCDDLTLQVNDLQVELQSAEQRQENYNEEFAQLEGQLAGVREENAILRQQAQQRQEQFEVLLAEAHEANARLLRTEVEAQQMQEQFEVRLAEVREENARLLRTEVEAQQRQGQFEEQLADLREQIARLLRTEVEAQQRQGQFEEQLADLREQIARLLGQLAEQRQENYNEEFAQLEEQLAGVREENAILRQQIDEVNGRNQIFRDWLNDGITEEL